MIRRILRSNLVLVIVTVAIAIGALILVMSMREGKSFMFSTPWVRRGLRNDIEAILLDYSKSLSTGHITREDYYTPMMRELIRERRGFYEGYCRLSTLDSIKSEFWLGSDYPGIEISALPNGQMSVKVTEKVTLRGRYNGSPPGVQVARWGISGTDNEAIRQTFEEYIQSVNNPSEDDFETVLLLRHYLVIAKDKDEIQVVQDTFTNRSVDSPSGTDNVIWKDGQFYRK